MAFKLAEVRAYLDQVSQEVQDAGDTDLLAVLAPIESQLTMLEGARLVAEQKTGCQQVSTAIALFQMMHPDSPVARKLNYLRIEIAQFGYMGRAA